MSFGTNLAQARKARRITQEQLAQQLGITCQAVSTWERDECMPDTAHLSKLAVCLDVSLDSLLGTGVSRDWTLKEMTSDPERMYTYVKAKAQAAGLTQTLAALPLMRERHAGQYRKSMAERAPYIAHPLTMACHALAMGLCDDDILAALLLHDVVEDTATSLEELPVNERVREVVRLVSYNSYSGAKDAVKPLYYKNIGKNPLAALVKCIDRCNNVSCMADGFSRAKLAAYVAQSEQYVLPLLDVVKAVPAWNDAAWLLRYQLTALLETFKRLI